MSDTREEHSSSTDVHSATNPLAFVTIGAASAALFGLGLPQHLAVSSAIVTALFVAIRRKPMLQHAGAAVGGAMVTLYVPRLLHLSIWGYFGTLVALGVVTGVVIGWRSAAPARPGFRFLREDFFEFCGFVGVLAAFPAVLAFGINGASDWVGRLAFELAFMGAWVLMPLCATAFGVGAARDTIVRRRTKRSRDSASEAATINSLRASTRG
ncbi:MAG TPA: hypothetical protein VGM67_06820 [Gemmatimonadaceae bacterium]|jgi:hypothetical protein